MSVWSDFTLKYSPPKVEDLTVGFSGIDPAGYAATLTEEQLEMVKALVLAYISKLTIRIDSGSIEPDAPPPEVQPVTLHPTEIPHELLDGLMGGDEDGHYHLTDVQLDKLKALIQALVPNGEEVKMPVEDHEKLSSLKGGSTGQHYHFTSDEWTKLRKILDKLFPDGATEPQFPSVPASTDEPSGGEDDPSSGTDYGGLPPADPPMWTMMAYPDGYSAWGAGVHKMYYGRMTGNVNGQTRLLVSMKKGNSSTHYFLTTNNLTSWDLWFHILPKNIGTYMGDYILSQDNKKLFLLGYPRDSKTIFSKDFNQTSTAVTSKSSLTNSSDSGATNWCAGCYSSTLKRTLFVAQNGMTCYLDDNETKVANNRYASSELSSVNPGCAAWIPTVGLFCVASSQGISFSADGTSWTVRKEAAIPKNLKDLTWRTDFTQPCLYAWREEDRKFYKSADGINWQTDGNLPSTAQVSTIAAVAYNPDYKEYCVVGGTSRYAYISANLKTWRQTSVVSEILNGIPMGSVIWMPSTKKYVLMPTSGNYFYTLDRTQWK